MVQKALIVLAEAAAAPPSLIATYAPLIVAAAGLGTAIVASLSRRDRRQNDDSVQMDARTNTAIRGLTEAYDRVEAERSREERRAVEAERTRDELLERVDELLHENQSLKEQLKARRARTERPSR